MGARWRWTEPPRRHGRPALAWALLAGVLSMLLPGVGQWLARRWWRGLALLGTAVGLVTAAVVVLAEGPGSLLAWLVRPGVLTAVLGANALLALFRVAAALDAYLLIARGGGVWRGPRLAAGAAGLVLVAATAAPHALAASYGWQARELLRSVFVEDAPPPPPDLEGPPPRVPAEHGTGAAAGDREAPEDDLPAPEEVPLDPVLAAPPTPAEDDAEDPRQFPWQERDRLTVALLGSDGGPGRSGERADALLLVSVEPSTGAGAVVSVPRNLEGYPLPAAVEDLAARCPDERGWRQLSGLYACLSDPQLAATATAEHYPETPDAAARAVADTLGLLVDEPVDHYAVVDLGGFVDVIDALGGVRLHVARPIEVELSPAREGEGWQHFQIPAGEQDLDGAHALAFVRSRSGSDDYDRMRRQRCLLGAVAGQTEAGELLTALPELTEVITDRVRTDIPVEALPLLVELAEAVEVDEIGALGLNPPRFQAADRSPQLADVRQAVAALLADPASAAPEVADAATAEQACH